MNWLPSELPSQPDFLWSIRLPAEGLGGIAATEDVVIFGDRDAADGSDVFRCLDSATGAQRWVLAYPALGELDYGNSPRATPLILDEHVILLGAMGDLHCVKLNDGAVVWRKNLLRDFGPTSERPWGTCDSPIVVEGKLIVRPGSPMAAIAAIHPTDGSILWQTPGAAPAYGSLLAGTFGGVLQVIGHDEKSLGGWNVATGERLWTRVPEVKDDFNVPMPVRFGEQLLTISENNGAELFKFKDDGKLDPTPIATNIEISPDMATPVVIDDRIYALFGELHCLSANLDTRELTARWSEADDAFYTYGSIIAGHDKILVTAATGELVLYGVSDEKASLISRLDVFGDKDAETYSHPAIVGERLYIRGADKLVCLDLGHE